MLLLRTLMNEFVQWCLDNLNLIIIVGSGVIEFILLFIFKRDKLIDNSFVSNLLRWIEEAERKYKLGCDKKAYVLDEAKKYLGDKFSYGQVSPLIEYVLTLPQKKEK